jgi:hypothetical protein
MRPVGTLGGAVSAHADVEANRAVRGDTLPAASEASTPSETGVAQVSPEKTYDVAVVDPTLTPFAYMLYPVTPTLSVEADHDVDTDDAVDAVAPNPAGCDGADVSADASAYAESGPSV